MPDEAKLPWYKKRKVQIPAAIIIVLFVFSIFIMAINYRFPQFFTLTPHESAPGQVLAVEDDPEKEPVAAPPANWPKGLMTANTLLIISDDLFGNWLPNDKFWPTIFLDNPQNFQLGELEALRYTTRVMRDGITRLRTGGTNDPDIESAFTLLNNDPLKWILPSAESRYKKAADHFRAYRDRVAVSKPDEVFFPTNDNLRDLLDQYAALLGVINTRLSNAPNQTRYKISEDAVRPADQAQDEQWVDTHVPWRQVDDNFYYAQGAAYVLRQMMVAIKYDFSKILTDREAMPQVDSIISVLNQAQFEPWWVMNGDVGSIWANHSMQLQSILENARQKFRNLNDTMGK